MGQLRRHIGGGRGHDDQIGTGGQGDVLHLMGEIAVKGIHHGPPSRQLFKDQGSDKFRGVLRHDDFHIGVLLDQSRCQSGGLVCGDAAADAQQDGFSFQHRGFLLIR